MLVSGTLGLSPEPCAHSAPPCAQVAPISVYTSGKGSSAAGLTAAVVQEASSREFFLEVRTARGPGQYKGGTWA